MNRFIFFVFILSFFIKPAASGQRYTLKHEGEGVKISYRWKKKFLFFFDQKKTLELFLANENDYRVSVSFNINVYSNAILIAVSDSLNYCLPPNYEMSGRFRNLEFDPELLPDDSVNDDDDELINWEIDDFNVVKDEDCETKANWRERL